MEKLWNIVADILSLLFVLAVIGFLGWRSVKKSEDPARLIVHWVITLAAVAACWWVIRNVQGAWVVIFALPFAIVLAALWAPKIASTLSSPLTGIFDGGTQEPERAPLYSMAESRRQRGQSEAALAETRRQLAMFPGDFTGIMLIAAIQAEDLKDLAAAQATIEEFLEQRKPAPTMMASALKQLADWQLHMGAGADAARATLQRIIDAQPDTPLAHAAAQRISHLEDADRTRTAREQAHYTVRPGERDIGLRAGFTVLPKADPAAEAEGLVRQLEKFPLDTEARENLASLYAEQFQRVDLAAEQLEQLIALPSEPPRRIAHWLNLLATTHARFGNDLPSAEAALRRIMERFPNTAMAEAAFARIATLGREVNANRQTSTVALGTYEKNVGLKPSSG